MDRLQHISALVTLSLLTLTGCKTPHLPLTGTELREELDSAIVADRYRLFIRLPPGYDTEPAKRYPVAYQLDADFLGFDQFHVTAGFASQFAAAGRIPEIIVVGIGYANGNKRDRDYVPPPAPDSTARGGRADLFYSFLRDELIPYVDAKYRTDTTQPRTLLGHSYGGLFTLYALMQYDPVDPPVFGQFVAGDSSYGAVDARLYGLEAELAQRTTSLPVSLYLTAANFTGAVQAVYHRSMVERLRSRGYTSFRFQPVSLETDHGGAIAPSFEQGLLFVFGGAR